MTTNDDDDIPPALKTFTTARLRQLMVDAATLAGSDVAGKVAADVYRRLARQCDALITARAMTNAARK